MEVVAPALVLAGLVAVLVLRPLRSGSFADSSGDVRTDLAAAKEAKYREIHDAELDHQMGKSSEEDWRALDRELRDQAIEILKRLDELDAR